MGASSGGGNPGSGLRAPGERKDSSGTNSDARTAQTAASSLPEREPPTPDSLLPRILSWLRVRWRRLLGLFVGVLLPLLVFGMLADEVVEQDSFSFDKPLLWFFHGLSNPALNRVMLAFSLLGHFWGVVPLSLLIGLALLWKRQSGDALFWFLAMGGTAALNLLAKPAFGRLRPNLWESIAPETTFSFPSGHAMGSMAFVTGLIVLLWPTRWRLPLLILGPTFVLGVSISRVYLGVHYPSDILAGWSASLSWVLGVSFILYRRFAKPRPETEPVA